MPAGWIDLTGKCDAFPLLVAREYHFTQQVGRRMKTEGHPGLLARSARCHGTTVAIFNPAVLSNPRLAYYLTYAFNPASRTVRVERARGEVLAVIDGRTWF